MWRGFVKIKRFYERHHLSIPNLSLSFYQAFVLPGNVSKSERFCFRCCGSKRFPRSSQRTSRRLLRRTWLSCKSIPCKVSFKSNTPLPGYSTWSVFFSSSGCIYTTYSPENFKRAVWILCRGKWELHLPLWKHVLHIDCEAIFIPQGISASNQQLFRTPESSLNKTAAYFIQKCSIFIESTVEFSVF